jgi:nitric oxide dioxygenase
MYLKYIFIVWEEFFMEITSSGLDEQTKQLIKATVPILQKHGTAITKRFYHLMLSHHPELKNLFNQTNQRRGDQPAALANTVYAAAANIDNLQTILPHVYQIAHKHKSLQVQPNQYPIVGKYLLLAMKDVLGDIASDDVITAWEKAYGVIANIFIQVEKQLYNATQQEKGGWAGFRDFKVVKKTKESDVITSFYLQPIDGLPFPTFTPGQYLTVKAEIPGEPYTHLRQYSLSTAPGKDYYRISVKREDKTDHFPGGIVSNFLHSSITEGSILPISAPTGYFTLDLDDTRPLVLISGGVGLTPMMSMLETVINEQPTREVIFIHAAKSSKYHAMKDKVATISKQNEQVLNYTIYSKPEEMDSYDRSGHISHDWLKTIIPCTDASFYFCGPKGFMKTTYLILKQLKVADSDIHYEIFGPLEDITAS